MKEYCYLGRRITEDGRSVSDIKNRLAQARRVFDSKRDLLESSIDLGVKKRFLKTPVWSVALYRSETWTVGAQERKRIEAFAMWCYRRMLKIRLEDHVTNETVLQMMGEVGIFGNS